MEYITISENIITGHISGLAPKDSVQVPDNFPGVVGDNVKMFDSNWQYLPFAKLVENGLIKLPKGYTVDIKTGQERRMTDAEEIAAKQKTRPAGQIIEASTGMLRYAALDEQVDLDDLSLPVLQSIACAMVDGTLAEKLDAGFSFEGAQYQVTPTAQVNGTAFLAAISAGFEGPIIWRRSDNVDMTFKAEEFKLFSCAMIAFAQSVYQGIWAQKDAIRSAKSQEEIIRMLRNGGYL